MSGIAEFIVDWVDLIWLPIAYYVATKRQRPWVIAFVLLCAFSMRLQIEVIHSTGFTTGFTKIFTGDVKLRATIVYAIFCALYLVMMNFSRRSYWSVWLSASIVVYITAFCVSMLVMAI